MTVYLMIDKFNEIGDESERVYADYLHVDAAIAKMTEWASVGTPVQFTVIPQD